MLIQINPDFSETMSRLHFCMSLVILILSLLIGTDSMSYIHVHIYRVGQKCPYIGESTMYTYFYVLDTLDDTFDQRATN